MVFKSSTQAPQFCQVLIVFCYVIGQENPKAEPFYIMSEFTSVKKLPKHKSTLCKELFCPKNKFAFQES